VEWIIQTTHYAQGVLVSLERDVKDWRQVVAELESVEVWKLYPPEKPYRSRDAFFIGEFGKPEPELTRAKVEQQLRAKGAPEGNQNRAKNKSRNTRIESLGESQTVARIRARLERDGLTEDLARIERGEITANAVAIEHGWRSRIVQHVATVDGFVRAIRKYLNQQQQAELIAALTIQ
jgi:hypothetical protein